MCGIRELKVRAIASGYVGTVFKWFTFKSNFSFAFSAINSCIWKMKNWRTCVSWWTALWHLVGITNALHGSTIPCKTVKVSCCLIFLLCFPLKHALIVCWVCSTSKLSTWANIEELSSFPRAPCAGELHSLKVLWICSFSLRECWELSLLPALRICMASILAGTAPTRSSGTFYC